MSTQSPPRSHSISPERQIIIDRVLKRVRLSKAKRVLQTRLRLAGFKASHGWQNVSFEKIEPQLSQRWKDKQLELTPSKIQKQPSPAQLQSRPSSPSYQHIDPSKSNLTTPDHQKLLSYNSQSQTTNTSSSRTLPQMSTNPFKTSLSSQNKSNPHTPEQTLHSKWKLNRPPSQTYSTPEDDELRDQTTAAEMMLFLATGSPSPNHRSINSVTPNQCNRVQLPPRFRT